MKRNTLRLWLGLLLVVLLIAGLSAGCTRSKSEGPEETEEAQTVAEDQTPEATGPVGPVPTLGEEEAMQTEAIKLAQTETAEAAQAKEPTPSDTPVPPEPTPVPTTTPVPPEPTEPVEATEPPEATEAPEPTSPPTTGSTVYVVKEGDNLFRIALKYGMSYEALAAYNNIVNPNLIRVGQEIEIPGGTSEPSGDPGAGPDVHIVQPGENLFRVALQYNLLYTQLAEANGLTYPYTIYPGQELVIP